MFLSAPSRMAVESQCLHLSLWMSSLVVVSALHPSASPSPHVLNGVTNQFVCRQVVRQWVDGGVGFCPLVESAQLLTFGCDLSHVSSSAISADGSGSLVVPPLVPRFQSVVPTTYEVTRVPKIWQPRHCGCLLTFLPSLRPHRCPPLASDLSGMWPWPTFLVRVRSWPDRLREYTDSAKEA